MSRWFRMYDEALDDHKVQSISPELFRTWFNLLCVASRENGVLPSVEKLAFALRVSIQDMQSRLDELVLVGLLDIREDRKIEPHNWAKRQWKSDDSKDRVRKHRHAKRHGNDDVTVTVTPPESDSETDTENKLLPSEQVAARSDELGVCFGSLKKVSGGKADQIETVKRQAGMLGLDVDEIIGVVNRNKVRNRSAYFTTLCVNRLKDKAAHIPEATWREALWGNDAAFGKASAALVGA